MPYWFFWTNRNEAKHSNHSTRLSILAIRALIAANDFINMPPSFKGIVKEVRDVPEEVPLLFSKQMGSTAPLRCQGKCSRCCGNGAETAPIGGTTRTVRGKAPYRPVHTGPAADRYADWSLPGGTAKIGRRRSISTIGGRLTEKSTVGGRLKKKKGKEERRSTWPPSSLARCPRALAARGSTTSCRRPRVARETPLPSQPASDYRPRVALGERLRR
ncbi:hypothetical protein BHM03_00022610 [Ensete ventricosum]|nr:hypothetical protein BHM03_00022610 [Ensete ventricosum]